MNFIEDMRALFVDSISTSIVCENIGINGGCDPTIRFDCNLIDLVLSSCKPVIYHLVRVTERFISSLRLEIVIQGFFVMTTRHMSEHSNQFVDNSTNIQKQRCTSRTRKKSNFFSVMMISNSSQPINIR